MHPVLIHIEPLDEVVSFSITTSSSITFLQLKQMIQQKTGVGMDRQILFRKEGADNWYDSSTLEGAGFKDAVEIGLMVLPLPPGTQINITISVPASYDFNLTVEDKLTVLELKQIICTFLNNKGLGIFFVPEIIQLSNLFTEMQNSDKLNSYFVNEGSKIIMLYN